MLAAYLSVFYCIRRCGKEADEPEEVAIEIEAEFSTDARETFKQSRPSTMAKASLNLEEMELDEV